MIMLPSQIFISLFEYTAQITNTAIAIIIDHSINLRSLCPSRYTSQECDVVECLARLCPCGVADKDIFIAQNLLSEVYARQPKREKGKSGVESQITL